MASTNERTHDSRHTTHDTRWIYTRKKSVLLSTLADVDYFLRSYEFSLFPFPFISFRHLSVLHLVFLFIFGSYVVIPCFVCISSHLTSYHDHSASFTVIFQILAPILRLFPVPFCILHSRVCNSIGIGIDIYIDFQDCIGI